MVLSDISDLRTIHQQIAGTAFSTAKELVAWMGAIQAQDYTMAKWAIGSRLGNSTDVEIEAAYNRGEFIRTHLMRPTWHFVSADDVYWMLELTSPQIKTFIKSREKQLELNQDLISKSYRIIERVLSKQKYFTREEINQEFEAAKINTDLNRLSHLLLRAELDGVICSGPMKAAKLTYSLLAERVQHKESFSRDEALAELAKRYFRSHGPATLPDFVWWSGLSVTDARRALESVKSGLSSAKLGAQTYWLPTTLSGPCHNSSVYLLPAYDEFLIAYRDRSAALAVVDTKKTISANGIFRPVVVLKGQVVGLWKRKTIKNKVLVEITDFTPSGELTPDNFEKAVKSYTNFLGKETHLILTGPAAD